MLNSQDRGTRTGGVVPGDQERGARWSTSSVHSGGERRSLRRMVRAMLMLMFAGLLTIPAASGHAASPEVSPVLIDDFTTGSHTATLTAEGAVDVGFQGGAGILGGARNTKLINGVDPRATPVTLSLGTANHLNLSVGAQQHVRYELSYGYTPAGAQAPLGIDITGHRAFVVKFAAAASPSLGLLAVQVHSGASYSQWGDHLTGGPDPFEVEIPLTAFVHAAGTDDTHVNFITFIFQTRVDMAIDSITLV